MVEILHLLQEGAGHQGSKASKVLFLGEKNRLFTTGFSRMSERQYAIWDTVSHTRSRRYLAFCSDTSKNNSHVDTVTTVT